MPRRSVLRRITPELIKKSRKVVEEKRQKDTKHHEIAVLKAALVHMQNELLRAKCHIAEVDRTLREYLG